MAVDSSQNRNRWSSYKDPVWAWEVMFDYTQTAPDQLLLWASEAMLALYETGIYKIFALPEIGYSSPTADPRPLANVIAERYRQEGVIDLLFFSVNSGHPDSEIATSLAYYGDENMISVQDCKDLAELQFKTQPWLDELRDSVYHRKPVVIDGVLFAPGNPHYPMERVALRTKQLCLRIATYTDIWLPQVRGRNEFEYHIERRWANEELAAMNGKRLNDAIRRMRTITASVGGLWRVDEDFVHQAGEFDEAGVVFAGSATG